MKEIIGSIHKTHRRGHMSALANKVAIVTGASSGIGYGTSKLFAQEGAKVVVTARRGAELDALVAQIEEAGGQAVAVAGDVRDESLAKALVDSALGRFAGSTLPSTMPVQSVRWGQSPTCRQPDGATRSIPT